MSPNHGTSYLTTLWESLCKTLAVRGSSSGTSSQGQLDYEINQILKLKFFKLAPLSDTKLIEVITS